MCSNTSRSPPTMIDAFPSARVTVLAEIGASSMCRPLAENSAATARLSSGAMVLMSM